MILAICRRRHHTYDAAFSRDDHDGWMDGYLRKLTPSTMVSERYSVSSWMDFARINEIKRTNEK